MQPDKNDPSDTEALFAIAATLLKRGIENITRAGGGGNSRIYRVQTDGDVYALKIYPLIAGDTRNRLGTEKKALTLFQQHGITCVPRWIADSPGHALLSWVEGEAVAMPNEGDIEAAVAFLGAVKRLSIAPEASDMPDASEACVSGAEVVSQIEGRLTRLRGVEDKPLQTFLKYKFAPAFKRATEYAKVGYREAALDFSAPLAKGRCLIPADFGFHNALRGADGALTFLDFEYFGWDDPAKLTADFLLHPAVPLAASLRHRLRQRMVQIHADDADFSTRLGALMPLFALRWVLILLNEFLPERWRARALAQGKDAWEAAKDTQMKKAILMLETAEKAIDA